LAKSKANCLFVRTRHPQGCARVAEGREDFIRLVKEDAGDRRESPGLLAKAASFAGAVVHHVAAACPKADADELRRRLAICEDCPKFNAMHRSCALCGCKMDVKASWSDMRCPDDPPKW
jgi:hypothetical protein